MSRQLEQSRDWSGDPLDSPYFRHVFDLTLPYAFSQEHRDAILNLAEGRRDLKYLKTMLFYVEYATWNVSEAHVQLELDRIDRAGPVIEITGEPVDETSLNAHIDRILIKPGTGLSHSKCVIETFDRGLNKTVHTYADFPTLDDNDQNEMNDLNRWRHKVIRHHVGIENFETLTGTIFHPLEEIYLFNRYSHQELQSNGDCAYEDITRDFNAVFEGVYLPGRVKPCGTRNSNAIEAHLKAQVLVHQGRYPPADNISIDSHFDHATIQRRTRRGWTNMARYRENESFEGSNSDEEQREGISATEQMSLDESIERWFDCIE